MRSAPIALAALVLLGAAPASGDAGAIDVRFALVEARGPQTLCRGLASGQWLILNWHCLADLRAALASGKRITVSRGGVDADLSADAIAQPLPSALKVAESAGLDFTLIASPLPPAAVLLPAPVAVHPGDSVELRQDGAQVATCRVSKICGSRVHYRACTVTPVRGWSGSSVWLTGAAPQLIGMHKDGPQYTNAGSARLLPAILGRSSILSPSDSAFAENFARNGRYRFVRAATPPERCEQAAAAIDVQPFITRGKRTIVGMARLGERDVLTADIDNGQICRFRWPSAAAVKCWDNPDPLNHRVNAVQPLGEGLLALAKSNDSTVGNDGSLRFLRLDPKQPIAGYEGEITAPIGSAVGLVEAGGDLVAIGSEGLCIVDVDAASRTCTRPPDSDGNWRVTGVLPLGPASFVAVGSDQKGGMIFPVCKWYERVGDSWQLVSRCAESPALMATARVMQSNGRELRFKAPVAVGQRLLAFASDGGAYQIARNTRPQPVAIRGVFGNDGRIEDAVRDARAVGPDHLALAASDGAFRIVKLMSDPNGLSLQAFDIGNPRYTAFDLAIWTTQIVTGDGWALVRGQDGGVYSATWARLP